MYEIRLVVEVVMVLLELVCDVELVLWGCTDVSTARIRKRKIEKSKK